MPYFLSKFHFNETLPPGDEVTCIWAKLHCHMHEQWHQIENLGRVNQETIVSCAWIFSNVPFIHPYFLIGMSGDVNIYFPPIKLLGLCIWIVIVFKMLVSLVLLFFGSFRFHEKFVLNFVTIVRGLEPLDTRPNIRCA